LEATTVIDNNDDIQWVRSQRPPVEPPDAEATGWARASLMFHAEESSKLTCLESRREQSDARPGRRRFAGLFKGHRGVAAAAAVAVMAAAGIAASIAGFPHIGNNGIDSLLGVDQAYAKPLLKLANTVLAVPHLRGDGTLVLRTHDIKGETGFTGADLYLDDGRYYYSMTAAGLPAAVKAGPQDFSLKAVVDAMAAVPNADPQAARAAFLKAVNPQWAGDIEHEATSGQDNTIWVTGIDVLSAAYGRPDVLAGMLRALATVDGVTVTPGVRDGVKTLVISMKVPEQTFDPKRAAAEKLKALGKVGTVDARLKQRLTDELSAAPKVIPAHLMQATVDANNGALLLYTDIGLTVTYHVTRVNAADYGLK
jgi:hypothetical protein